MKFAWLILTLCATLLAAWSWSLESGAGEDAGAPLLTPLIALDERAGLQVAALTIEGLPQGDRFVYVRQDGRWTCPSVHGAQALTLKVEELIADLSEAWCESLAPAERAAAYSFDAARPLRILLHGPNMAQDPERDVLLAVELGMSLPGLGDGRGTLRISGAGDVLEIDRNPRARIVPTDAARRLPPLLDERLLAGEWPKLGEGIERAFIDHTAGRSIEVRSRVLGPAPSADRPPPREWIAVEGERTARCLPYRIGGWQGFLYKLKVKSFSDPGAAARRGLDAPVAKITLMQVDGDPIELVIGRSAPGGATFVMNSKNGMLCLLDRSDVELLLADVDTLCSTDVTNPWEAWLPR